MNRILAIIPARYQSSRLPAKMLAAIGDKPLVQHVYERVRQVLPDVVIATDHPAIFEAATNFGASVRMTDAAHPSGTDRCAEVLRQLQAEGQSFDLVLNIQGDEPFIQPQQLQALIDIFNEPQAQIGTLVQRIHDAETLFNPNAVKAVLSNETPARALYFSRQTLPYQRGKSPEDWLSQSSYYKHIGLYGFRAEVLLQLTQLSPSMLEQAEALEQLRWLENGYRIYVQTTEYTSIGVDTPEDLERARKIWAG